MAFDQHHWLVTVALVTSSLIAFIANLLLVLVFCRRRGLRTISNRFTINLLLSNLLSSTLLIPLLIVDQELTPTFSNFNVTINTSNNIIFQEETVEQKGLVISDLIVTTNESDYIEEDIESFNDVLCYVAQSIVALTCTASILSVLLIGIDQYFAVIHSLRYHSYIDKSKSLVLIVTSWAIAIVFGIFGALAQNKWHFWRFCSNVSGVSEVAAMATALNSVYALTYFVLVILVPFLAICVIYVCIYAAAHNNSERMRKSKGNSHSNLDNYIVISREQKAPSDSRLDLKSDAELDCKTERQTALPKVQSAPNFINLIQEQQQPPNVNSTLTKVTRTNSDRVGFMTNLRSRLSNASVFRYREETRAAKISILVIFMVLICYIPYGIAVVLNSNTIGVTATPLINFISLVLLIVSNIISPFLFAYRNRRIRRELLRFLGVTLYKNQINNTLRRSIVRPKLVNRIIEEECEHAEPVQPFLLNDNTVPQVVITCKLENEQTEKTSILKRVCSTKNWATYKKCSFMTVPESCWQTDSARGSFSSASTQMSADE